MMSIAAADSHTALSVQQGCRECWQLPDRHLIGIGSFVPKHRLKRRLNAERDRAMTVFGNPLQHAVATGAAR